MQKHFTESVDVSLSKLWEMVRDREAWWAAIHGVSKRLTQLNDIKPTITSEMRLKLKKKKKGFMTPN